ncbi:MAG: ribosome small subunit-dependent GTPase A [Acetatifactor sp.]
MQGKIIKGISNFYYVASGDSVYECKAKGVFRKDRQKPLVGDNVELEVLDSEKKIGNIVALSERKSRLIRPAVANVDQALVIFAIQKPRPNFNLLDRFLIMMEQQGLPCIVCFNKADLDHDGTGEQYAGIYEKCGYRTVVVSASEQKGIEILKELLYHKTTTVAGPSGVGKSSLINELMSEAVMETGKLSAKIERGKHTTRHTQLMAFEKDSYILDTPGFSSLELFDLTKEELAGAYPEFAAYEEGCKFRGCSHISEPVCGVKQAVEQGEIARLRYDNYCLLYQELKNKKKY